MREIYDELEYDAENEFYDCDTEENEGEQEYVPVRRTGKSYRRTMHRRQKKKLLKIMTYGYNPAVGYVRHDLVGDKMQPVGNHIQYFKNSSRQTYWKNQSNRKVRRYDGEISSGNAYRRCFTYKNMIW